MITPVRVILTHSTLRKLLTKLRLHSTCLICLMLDHLLLLGKGFGTVCIVCYIVSNVRNRVKGKFGVRCSIVLFVVIPQYPDMKGKVSYAHILKK